MRPLFLLALPTALVLMPAPAGADYYCRSRSCYGYAAPAGYSYSYHAAGYYQGRYYPAGFYYYANGVYYLQGHGACYGYASPADYHAPCYQPAYYDPPAYASVRDYYRDALLADSIAYKVLVGQAALKSGKQPEPPASQDPAPAPQPKPKVSVSTPVSAALQKYVNESCIKCHQGGAAKAGVDLSNLATLDAGTRWAAAGVVASGEMPQDGTPASDDVAKEFYQHARNARNASKALQAGK